MKIFTRFSYQLKYLYALLIGLLIQSSVFAQLDLSISSCNQGYTASGVYRIRYEIEVENNTVNPVSGIQVFDDLEAAFADGCISAIDRRTLRTRDPNGGDFTSADWDTAEFDASDASPGNAGILNATSVANDGNMMHFGSTCK